MGRVRACGVVRMRYGPALRSRVALLGRCFCVRAGFNGMWPAPALPLPFPYPWFSLALAACCNWGGQPTLCSWLAVGAIAPCMAARACDGWVFSLLTDRPWVFWVIETEISNRGVFRASVQAVF